MNSQDELRELWCSQPSLKTTKGEDMLALVQKRTSRFDRIITIRNAVECVAAGIVATFFLVNAVRTHEVLQRTGSLVIAVGALWIIFYVLRYGKADPNVDPSQTLTGYTQALASRYDYQIHLLRSVKYWYLLPLYVGLLIASAGILLGHLRAGSLSLKDFWGPAFYTAVFAAVWWLNEVYAVGRLRKERTRLLSLTSDGADKTE